jgi:outer membrane lipoprotein-sorting protein
MAESRKSAIFITLIKTQFTMKRKIFISAILALAVMSFSNAQDLDKVLKEHFKAIGQKNLEKITSQKAIGTVTIMGMGMDFTMYKKRPDKYKMMIVVQGAEMIQAVDGETAWTINPMMGSSAAVELTGVEAATMKEQADMDGMLWSYKDKGYQLALEEGSEEVNGKDCYVLKLTKENGNNDFYYLDKGSYMIQKVKTTTESYGTPMEVETLLSNYQDVDGYMMPFKIEQMVGGQVAATIEMESVETNVELDDSMFTMPSSN